MISTTCHGCDAALPSILSGGHHATTLARYCSACGRALNAREKAAGRPAPVRFPGLNHNVPNTQNFPRTKS